MENRNPELTIIRGHEDVEMFGRVFDVKFTVHKTDSLSKQLPQIIDFNKNKMIINIQKFNNGIYDYESFHDALSHELLHGFQRFKKNKPLIADDGLYDDAVDIILGKKTVDDFTNDIAKLIYFSKTPEQDAIIQGVYSQCLQRISDNPKLSISEVFSNIAILREIQNLFRDLKNGLNQQNRFSTLACNNFNKTPNYFYKLLLKSDKRFKRKLTSMKGRLIDDIKQNLNGHNN